MTLGFTGQKLGENMPSQILLPRCWKPLIFKASGDFADFKKNRGFAPIFYAVNPHGYWAHRYFLCGKFEF